MFGPLAWFPFKPSVLGNMEGGKVLLKLYAGMHSACLMVQDPAQVNHGSGNISTAHSLCDMLVV